MSELIVRSALLPPNQTRLEAALANAVQWPLTPETIATLWDAATCPPSLLPWLAWALSVDEWDSQWPDERKRNAVLQSIALHRKKGTPWAVKTALAAIGYPVLELVEQRAYHDAWVAAGGLVLDGGWQIDGTATLNPPPGEGAGQLVRRSALNHWAEYAIRLNVADGVWTREQQRKIRATAERYAPVRSHLVSIITSARANFSARIRLAGYAGRVHTRLDRCRRLSAYNRITLDGCWLIDGDDSALTLDGWVLDGRRLCGTTPTGAPLNHGAMTMRTRTRQRIRAAMGGQRSHATTLGGVFMRLDGRRRLSEGTLGGGWTLGHGVTLADATLGRVALPRIDGTWFLGGEIGRAGLWFSGTLTTRRKGITTKELI